MIRALKLDGVTSLVRFELCEQKCDRFVCLRAEIVVVSVIIINLC